MSFTPPHNHPVFLPRVNHFTSFLCHLPEIVFTVTHKHIFINSYLTPTAISHSVPWFVPLLYLRNHFISANIEWSYFLKFSNGCLLFIATSFVSAPNYLTNPMLIFSFPWIFCHYRQCCNCHLYANSFCNVQVYL